MTNKEKYLAKLKECGFRSWKRANERRFALIDKSVDNKTTHEEEKELENLQALTSLYLDYKCPNRFKLHPAIIEAAKCHNLDLSEIFMESSIHTSK